MEGDGSQGVAKVGSQVAVKDGRQPALGSPHLEVGSHGSRPGELLLQCVLLCWIDRRLLVAPSLRLAFFSLCTNCGVAS